MYGFIITTAGEGLLARASAGEGLTLTEVWVGKGAVESAGAAKALTALLDPVAKATSTTPAVAGGQISMLVEYRNDMGGGLEEGFTLSEFGVMAKVGDDAPTLLYYAALGDRAQPVPPIAEGLDVHRFPVAIGVTGEVEVSLEYPAGVWVTHEELEEAMAGIDLSGYIKATEKGQPGGVATLGPDGKVPAGQLPAMNYDPAGSAAAVQETLTNHINNKNNPHNVTAAQVGALASSGGVMSGALSMSGHKIANLAAPAAPTDAANKQYVDEHTGAKVVTGSYVGTGKTGKNNPTEISLPKPFKVLCIYGMQYPDSYYDIYPTDSTGTGQTCNIISGSSIPTEYTRYFGFFYSSKPSDSYGKKSADGKTFSWYYDLTPSSAASVQLNKSGTIYHYYAIL
ncbi:hypothetical protein ABHB30_13255 [Flavonifractor plautii]|uniref:hypothetical protein n=1 Tax=Flavonifractor plautii TaxID=292800 RepID=UPI001D0960E9|nr:hypothetical protein [Flavonifractor plautii]MBS6800425.1 hypothetical protein [Clostridiales bacterium]MCB6873123.1 hypothetical protein [Flavonifractor plautii]